MQRLPIALLFFLIALCFNWNTAKAQELAALPDQIQGNWALPDCGTYDEALVFSRYFYLRSLNDTQTLLPAGLERQAEDYAILSLKDQKAPIRFENDGILTIAVLEAAPARRVRNWPNDWEKLPIDQTIEYTGCTDAPTVVPQNLQRLMRYIDRIQAACTVSLSNDCTRVLFKYADTNHDNKIDRTELQKGLVNLAFLSELAGGAPVTVEQGRQAVEAMRTEEAGIVQTLIATYDTDQSKDLDYNEIVADVAVPALPLVQAMLDKIGALLPAFKMAAVALPDAPVITEQISETVETRATSAEKSPWQKDY